MIDGLAENKGNLNLGILKAQPELTETSEMNKQLNSTEFYDEPTGKDS